MIRKKGGLLGGVHLLGGYWKRVGHSAPVRVRVNVPRGASSQLDCQMVAFSRLMTVSSLKLPLVIPVQVLLMMSNCVRVTPFHDSETVEFWKVK